MKSLTEDEKETLAASWRIFDRLSHAGFEGGFSEPVDVCERWAPDPELWQVASKAATESKEHGGSDVMDMIRMAGEHMATASLLLTDAVLKSDGAFDLAYLLAWQAAMARNLARQFDDVRPDEATAPYRCPNTVDLFDTEGA